MADEPAERIFAPHALGGRSHRGEGRDGRRRVISEAKTGRQPISASTWNWTGYLPWLFHTVQNRTPCDSICRLTRAHLGSKIGVNLRLITVQARVSNLSGFVSVREFVSGQRSVTVLIAKLTNAPCRRVSSLAKSRAAQKQADSVIIALEKRRCSGVEPICRTPTSRVVHRRALFH